MKNDKYKVGQIYKIELKGKHWCYAKLCLIQTTKLFDVSHYDVFMDTGMTRVEFCNLIEKMYKNYDYNPKEQLWQFLYFKKVSEAQISGFNK
jgi:hypothetical protein